MLIAHPTIAHGATMPLANAAPLGFRVMRAIRRALHIDRERRWNAEYSKGGWDWLRNLDELAHHAILAGYFRRLKPNGAVLDVGCGDGVLLDLIRGSYSRYLGIDFAAAIRLAEAHTDAQTAFQTADMNEFSTAERFDAIIFNESAYYHHNAVAGMRHYETMLASGGVFLISMHGKERNDAIWTLLDERYAVADAVTVRNQSGVTWTAKVLVPPTA